jgi:Cu2+-exporting ATPase
LFYAAIFVALITAAAWIYATGFNSEVIMRVATVLVTACPHALGLAIPLVVAISTSLAANNGILVRNRIDMEKARSLNVVIFDKTGTLTQGEFGLADLSTAQGISNEQAISAAAAVESDSEHTIARGIRQAASEHSLNMPDVDLFKALKGLGVRARINGEIYYIGSRNLLDQLELQLSEAQEKFSKQAEGKGQTLVYLADEQQVLAAMALADRIRPESKAAVDKLHEMGIQVAMITGDSQAAASAVAGELGINRVFAEVRPEKKDQKVQQMQEDGSTVAMVGDGVNDAPALSRADVGIAIGSGTDVAVESAGVILIKSNPLDVVRVIELSHATYRKMVQNLFWAAGYNVIALPLAAGALVSFGILPSPAFGALLMSLSTVIVALNAQLLRRLDLQELITSESPQTIL